MTLNTHGSGYWEYNETQYYPCLRPEACLGAKNQIFKKNHARGSSLGECKICKTETNVFVFILGVLVATVGTSVLVKITVFKERKVRWLPQILKLMAHLLRFTMSLHKKIVAKSGCINSKM